MKREQRKIEVHIGELIVCIHSLDAAGRRRLRRQMRALTPANCWWATYELRDFVLGVLRDAGRSAARKQRHSRRKGKAG